jgi:hypothetical protein
MRMGLSTGGEGVAGRLSITTRILCFDVGLSGREEVHGYGMRIEMLAVVMSIFQWTIVLKYPSDPCNSFAQLLV